MAYSFEETDMGLSYGTCVVHFAFNSAAASSAVIVEVAPGSRGSLQLSRGRLNDLGMGIVDLNQ